MNTWEEQPLVIFGDILVKSSDNIKRMVLFYHGTTPTVFFSINRLHADMLANTSITSSLNENCGA